MSSPRRFTKGVTNVASDKTMGQMITMDPTSVHVWMQDFHDYNPNQWVTTRSDPSLPGSTTSNLMSGIVGAVSSETIVDAVRGVLQIKTSLVDDANIWYQWVGDTGKPITAVQTAAAGIGPVVTKASAPSENWVLTSGKKLWMKSRMKIDDIDTCDFQMGLMITDTSPLASAPSDGVYFQSDDADEYLDFLVKASSVAILTDNVIATLVDDTYFTIGFYYDGTGRIKYFVNDIEVGESTASTLPTTEMTVSFGIQNGSAAQSTMSIDYICVVMER